LLFEAGYANLIFKNVSAPPPAPGKLPYTAPNISCAGHQAFFKYRRKYARFIRNGIKFAKLISVSNARVSNWEQGLNRPDVDILASICNVLKVNPNELLDIRPDMGTRFLETELSKEEAQIISQYRKKPDLQHAVRLLLGIDKF